MSSVGPDRVSPAEDFVTIDASKCVKLRIHEDSVDPIETIPPISIPGLLKEQADIYPDVHALAFKDRDGKYNFINYKEYLDLVRVCAKAFLAIGLERHHSVCILGFNSPEWFIADLGAIFAGGIAVGIYPTNSADACFHCLETSKANIVVVQNMKQLRKILDIKSRLPLLKRIILYTGKATDADVLHWEDMITFGEAQSDEALEEVLKTLSINECCTLVFTSGTVGPPKGVMLSHDNMIFNARQISGPLNMKMTEGRVVSYLPLSHAAAQIIDIYMSILNAGCTYFADEHAFKGSLINTLKEAHPTVFFAVPRVFEKIMDKVQAQIRQSNCCKKLIIDLARGQVLNHYLNKNRLVDGEGRSYLFSRNYVLYKIKQALGLDHCRAYGSSGAPLLPDVKKFFMSLDMPIIDGYGMSESSGGHIANLTHFHNLETIGTTFPGFKTKLVDNEICMYGRHVFMGYLNDEEQTKAAIDSDYWLHTGDLGRQDEDGLFYISGRIKEILITSGGENVAPLLIERNIKEALPCVSEAVLVGDQRKFLTVLLTLKTEIDTDNGKPLDNLLPCVEEWLRNIGCPAKTVSEVLLAGPHPKLLQAIRDGLNVANDKAISNAQKVHKFTILPDGFSVVTGEFGPTMKLKRKFIVQKYASIIEKMYRESSQAKSED